MNEAQEIEQILTGVIPANYSDYGSGVDTRKKCYTWNDIAFNMNNNVFDKDTAIIVTSYYGHLGYLKATLKNYRKSGAYVILAYDNNSYIWDNLDDTEYILRHLPRPIHTLLAHSVVMKHKTYDSDKRLGWFWDVRYAQGLLKNLPNIKYVYVTNGDCIIERPEGISELPALLGDGDLMSGQSTPGGTIHTADIFLKIDAFNKIMDYMTYRHSGYVIDSQSPEGLLRDAVDELNLKETFSESRVLEDGTKQVFSGSIDDRDNSIDYYGIRHADSVWNKILGFRNLYHEFEYYENNGLVPPDCFSEYMDNYKDWIYFREDWRKSICKYFETKDRRYLQMFWDRGKDSCEDRKFLELDEYGKDPIYAEVSPKT